MTLNIGIRSINCIKNAKAVLRGFLMLSSVFTKCFSWCFLSKLFLNGGGSSAVDQGTLTVGANVTVKADAICLINGVQSTRTIAASSFSWSSSLGGGSIDVSPSVISSLLPNGAVLKEYTITMLESNVEKDSCRYIVDSVAAVRQLCWLNRWGVYETLVLKGSETLNASRAATYGFTGDDWSALDMEVTDEYECSTGYVGENEWNQVRDMAESPIVWLWDGVWHRVTITDAKLSHLRPTNEARSCVVTYRLSDREEITL